VKRTTRMISRPPRSFVVSRRRDRSRGAGTLMVTGVIVGVAVVAWAILGATSFLTAQHRARATADMAALAGAQAVVDAGGLGDATTIACDAARVTAAAHQAAVNDCQVVAFARFVAVQTKVSVGPPFVAPGFPQRLEAVARAGNPTEE